MRHRTPPLARLLLASVLALLLVPVVLMTAAAPASACSCVGGSLEDFVERADVVFAATADDAQDTEPEEGVVDVDVTVNNIWKGDLPDRVVVTTASQESACGITIPDGSSWIFFATATGDGRYSTGSCSGSRDPSPAAIEAVSRLLGDGHGPAQATDEGSSPAPEDPEGSSIPQPNQVPDRGEAAEAGDGGGSGWWVAGLAGAAVLVGAGAVVVWRRR